MTPTAGLSFKPVHFEQAMACPAAGMWFEVHAENYMVDGGPRLAMLEALRKRFPLSIHGVGLSLAGVEVPDREHLSRLKRLVDRFEPFLLSEHLAWSRFDGTSHPDLLPFPRTNEALEIIARNIDITQDVIGRQILIENPSLYLHLDGHEWPESLFLAELVKRTGCGLLIDVNNVFVSANNVGLIPISYLDALPRGVIGEIHLAGHNPDPFLGGSLLIDSHDAPISEEVWKLYDWLLARRDGERPPTLIERDDNLPDFDELLAERERAACMLAGCGRTWPMPDLAAFQREFAAALLSHAQPVPWLRSQAFAVYRNTSARGAVEALRATYSTVDQLLGADGFTQVALDYRREEPPAGPVLSDYGAGFPAYLTRQPWTSELPYLADVARLDWLWLESFLAADADALPRQSGVIPRIMLHPATRFAWLPTPALTIWQAHRDPHGFNELEPEWREEGALFTRPGLCVRAQAIDPACHHLLLSCATPSRVDDCVTAVAAAFPEADVPKLLEQCVASGALIIQ